MGVKVTLNASAIKSLGKKLELSALKTMEALKTDVASAQTMPFNSGNLQDGGTYTDKFGNPTATVNGNEVLNFSEGGEVRVALVNDAPQARRLYFHPEFNFQKGNHPNAGGKWLEPYIDGEKKDFVEEAYAEFLKGEIDK